MPRNKALTCLAVLLALAPGLCRAQAPVATPSVNITPGNVTMTNSGVGSIPFTLTSVNGFAGEVGVTCTPPNPPAGVREPNCPGGGPPHPPIPITADATAAGSIGISAEAPLPATGTTYATGRHMLEWAFAAVFMLGLGLRRKKENGYTRLLLTVGLLIGLMGTTACGSKVETLTPGVYSYTLTAVPYGQINPAFTTSATANVTVPPGVDVIFGTTRY
jgi:hypothetical protein